MIDGLDIADVRIDEAKRHAAKMYLSDPSEGIRSGEILPAIHRKFELLEEKKVGGELLAPESILPREAGHPPP
ncbi:MAG: hypothetical protein ABIY63_04555 [Fibrobacteria bacterium]